ncbi:MAG: AmmeMemoRadiSam system protein B [Caldilineaceae bacterium]|nr:AmmeMemoRadiSam system protein B [Caldilineaceae bacterium]
MPIANRIVFPKLRPVDVRPYQQNGQPYYLLRDPLDLSEGSLLVPQYFGPLLALCDGTLEDARALGVTLMARYGMNIDAGMIGDLLSALDEALLLENERTVAALARKREAYRRLPFRTATLAGLSYPAERRALAQLLDGYIEQTVPTRNGRANGAAPGRRNGQSGHPPKPGIFSPHIDYPRGGTVYAPTWKTVEDAVQSADLAILIGTDHYGDDLFTLTRQNYATPYGMLPTNTIIVDDLAAALGEEAAYAGEMRHCNEHSLELVAVWLHHMRGGRPLEIVPVLCGSLHRFYANGHSPADHAPIGQFLETMERHCAGRNVFVVASGDLAHVGPAFGGAPLTQQDRLQVRSADRDLLTHLCAGDADGFFDSIRRIRNRHNVCGATPGYLALKLMGNVHGQEMAYQSCPADDHNTSAVTVAGVAYL